MNKLIKVHLEIAGGVEQQVRRLQVSVEYVG